MSNITIWYRRQNESKYHKITQWINRNNQDPLISWNRDINDKFFQFTLKLYNPLDSDLIPFIPDTGDEFVVTDWQNNIFGNIFIGIAEEIKRSYYGLDNSEQATNKYFDILVQNKDFSTEKGITERLNSSYINDLLPSLFNNTPSLGGVLSNGINIPKHDYGGENFLIPPLKLVGSQYERLLKLLDLIGWAFIYFYYSELSDTNGLHIVKQLNMFPKNSGRSASSDWQPGITFQSFTTGILATNDTENIICERNITYKKSNRQLKNSIELKLNLKSSISDVGKKFRQEVTEEKNVFLLGGAFDVKSIAIEIITFISSVISDSVFTISAEKASAINYYQERMNNNSLDGLMECDINSGSVDYNRVFTLDVLTNTITLAEPITGLVNGSKFTLTGAYNLLEPNLNSYPPDGNGYVIKNVDSENTSIKFTDYDMPNIGSFITGYYYPIETTYKTKNDTDSIDKLGFRGLEEEIKEPITNEQGEELFTEIRKKMKALEVLNLETSHRKNVLNLYTSIPVDFEDIKKVFIVTASEGKVIHDEGFYTNTPLITQQIELSTYKDNYGDLLSKIQNNSKATMNLNLKNKVEEIIRASIFIREKSNDSLPSLITPIMLDPTNVLNDRFTINFISSNVSNYRLIVSNTIDFTDTITYLQNFPSESEVLVTADIPLLSFTYPIYVKIQAVRGVELSPFSNTKQVETRLTQFPATISGSWGTKTLNYNYVFSPQSSGDLTNYGSSTGTAPYLDRRNSGDNYPAWVNSEGSWGLDFSSSPYSGVRIPLNNLPSTNVKSTIIVIAKLKSNLQAYVLMNPSDTVLHGEDTEIGGSAYGISLYGRNGAIGEGYSTNDFNFNSINDMIATVSVDYSNNTATIVNNDNVNSILKNGNFITYNSNNIDALLGTSWINGNFIGTPQDIIIKKVAVIYDTLSDIQILELHRLMGFTYPTAITPLQQFPTSITGSWGTLTLNYGYVFRPQNSGDLIDYSGNGNTVSLERRNSGDSYATWTQDPITGLWGMDFTSPYSALKIADNTNIELGSEYTIIALVKLNNIIDGTYRCISFKWNTNNINGSAGFYFQDKAMTVHLRGSTGGSSNGYIFHATEEIADNNISAYSTSLKCSTNSKFLVKNQTSSAISTESGAGLVSSITSVKDIPSDMFLGGFIPYNTSTGLYDWSSTSILKGKLFGYAIIKQALTQAQIKEIHRLMGF